MIAGVMDHRFLLFVSILGWACGVVVFLAGMRLGDRLLALVGILGAVVFGSAFVLLEEMT